MKSSLLTSTITLTRFKYMADTNPTPKSEIKVTEKKFEDTLVKLTEALQLKLETNYLDQLQVNQILTNYKETKNYEDIKQYLE